MATVTVNKNTYTVEPLYQWDLNQQLEVYGLSLATVPEVHFTNAAMDKAIVRQATMDAAGVIRAEVPNSLLQKPYTILAYICTYAGSTFETQYKLEIPVKGRAKPNDYTLVDDPEVYSFNALENQVANALRLMDAEAGVAATKYAEATSAQETAAATYASAEQLLRDTVATIAEQVDEKVDEAVAAIPFLTVEDIVAICV